MGSCLYISCRDGEFEIESLRKRLLSDGSAIELEDAPNEFVLINGHKNDIQLPMTSKARLDQKNPAWNCPVVVLTPSRITVGVNWTDTAGGDLKAFCQALFDAYQCKAECSDGYVYEDNRACWDWVHNWLP